MVSPLPSKSIGMHAASCDRVLLVFVPKIIFVPKTFFGPKILLDSKFFGPKIFSEQNLFGHRMNFNERRSLEGENTASELEAF